MKGNRSTRSGRSGVIVWSAWDPAAWEITDPFDRSWGCLIRNCYDWAHSTHGSRAKQNELDTALSLYNYTKKNDY